MSSILPSPLPNVSTAQRGALTPADKIKLDAISGANTGDVTLAAVGAVPNANGASLAGQTLTLQPASASFPGIVTAGVQTFAGAKTFSEILTALSVRTGIGSATDVAYGTTGDPNTGIWFPVSDTINFVTGGNLRFSISSTGAASFQGSITMPTNTLLTLGGSTVYDSPSGTLNWNGRHQWFGVTDPALRLGTGNDSSSSIAFYSTANAAFSSFTSRTFIYSRNTQFCIESSTGELFVGGNQGLGPATTGIALTGSGYIKSNTLGAGASDVCLRLGSGVADATVHSTAKLFSVGTGIGGTYTEKFNIMKDGLRIIGTRSPSLRAIGSNAYLYGDNDTNGYLEWNTVRWHINSSGVSAINTMVGGLTSQCASGVNGFGLLTDGSRISLLTSDSLAYFQRTAAGIIGTPAEVEMTTAATGVILKSPNGTRYRVTVDNAGALVVTAA
jgi:hypothetical protein